MTSTARAACPACAREDEIPEFFLGKRLKCKDCGADFTGRAVIKIPAVLRCPYCHTDILAKDPKQGCQTCTAWSHGDCWAEFGGCAACNERTRRPRRRIVHLLLAGFCGALLVSALPLATPAREPVIVESVVPVRVELEPAPPPPPPRPKPVVRTPKPKPRPTSWTLGSSRQQVLALQGTPDALTTLLEETTWCYGHSSVTFDAQGRVKEFHNLDQNLKVELE